MAVDSSNIANKDFPKFSKGIDKKLIILVLVFFLAVFAIFYYESKIIKELESLISFPVSIRSIVIKNSEEKIARMSYTQRKDITRVLGTIKEMRGNSFVIGKERDLLLIDVPPSGITILEQEKTPDGIATTIKPTSHLTNESIGRKAVVILDKEAEGYPERLVAKEIHILTKE